MISEGVSVFSAICGTTARRPDAPLRRFSLAQSTGLSQASMSTRHAEFHLIAVCTSTTAHPQRFAPLRVDGATGDDFDLSETAERLV